MNNIKYPVFVGLFLLSVGMGAIFSLKALHFFTSSTPSFLQSVLLLACSSRTAAGGVLIFLHYVRKKYITIFFNIKYCK